MIHSSVEKALATILIGISGLYSAQFSMIGTDYVAVKNAEPISSTRIQTFSLYSTKPSIYSSISVLRKLREIEEHESSAVERIAQANSRVEKAQKLKEYLENLGSPLAGSAATFIAVEDELGVDYKMLVSIAIIESGGGKICFRSYNPFGWGTRGFKSFDEAIWTVARGLKSGYYAYGLDTVNEIAYKYNGSNPVGWAAKVNARMQQIP